MTATDAGMAASGRTRGAESVMDPKQWHRLCRMEAGPMMSAKWQNPMMTLGMVTESWPSALFMVLLLPARGHGAQCSGTTQ